MSLLRFLPRHRVSEPGDAAVAASILGVAAVAVRFAPPGAGSIYPPCPFHWATGWQCPGCGSLRALHALTDGDLTRAWSLNPLFVIFLGTLAAVLLLGAARVRMPAIPTAAYRAIPAVIVVFWVARNLW